MATYLTLTGKPVTTNTNSPLVVIEDPEFKRKSGSQEARPTVGLRWWDNNRPYPATDNSNTDSGKSDLDNLLKWASSVLTPSGIGMPETQQPYSVPTTGSKPNLLGILLAVGGGFLIYQYYKSKQ